MAINSNTIKGSTGTGFTTQNNSTNNVNWKLNVSPQRLGMIIAAPTIGKALDGRGRFDMFFGDKKTKNITNIFSSFDEITTCNHEITLPVIFARFNILVTKGFLHANDISVNFDPIDGKNSITFSINEITTLIISDSTNICGSTKANIFIQKGNSKIQIGEISEPLSTLLDNDDHKLLENNMGQPQPISTAPTSTASLLNLGSHKNQQLESKVENGVIENKSSGNPQASGNPQILRNDIDSLLGKISNPNANVTPKRQIITIIVIEELITIIQKTSYVIIDSNTINGLLTNAIIHNDNSPDENLGTFGKDTLGPSIIDAIVELINKFTEYKTLHLDHNNDTAPIKEIMDHLEDLKKEINNKLTSGSKIQSLTLNPNAVRGLQLRISANKQHKTEANLKSQLLPEEKKDDIKESLVKEIEHETKTEEMKEINTISDYIEAQNSLMTHINKDNNGQSPQFIDAIQARINSGCDVDWNQNKRNSTNYHPLSLGNEAALSINLDALQLSNNSCNVLVFNGHIATQDDVQQLAPNQLELQYRSLNMLDQHTKLITNGILPAIPPQTLDISRITKNPTINSYKGDNKVFSLANATTEPASPLVAFIEPKLPNGMYDMEDYFNNEIIINGTVDKEKLSQFASECAISMLKMMDFLCENEYILN